MVDEAEVYPQACMRQAADTDYSVCLVPFAGNSGGYVPAGASGAVRVHSVLHGRLPA